MNDLIKRLPKKPNVPGEIQAQWQRILNLMARISGFPAGAIMKADPPQIEVFLSSETAGNPFRGGERLPLNPGLYCEKVINSRAPLLIADALKDPEWEHSP